MEPTMTVDDDGTRRWHLNGHLHREHGPAVVRADSSRSWYINGRIHRTDGPAYEGADGTLSWWIRGERHREDGPAYDDSAHGDRGWYLRGEELTFYNWLAYVAESEEQRTELILKWG